MSQGTAVIIGAGSGLSASVARKLHARGHDLVLGARNTEKLAALASETNARTVAIDGSNPEQVNALFDSVKSPLRVAVYNPSSRQRGPIVGLDPEEVRRAVEITAFGSFLMGQAAARIMQDQDEQDGKRGTILFTGASAGVKGFAQSAPFAMGKFAQRGLAQSMARELHPKGIHVAWVNIDGGISNTARSERTDDGTDKMLDPDAIATAYMQLIDQHRSTWSNELSLRPWVERF
ncbi:SDR family oxidoreductase [Tateyamaria omphalii]|uniref:SDR family NAD(P)-dependent oxidoreductase n=1 Tax=Tateyamaria omphalii TaxID=299262 RepID=UPI00167488F5|nr:SDR family NAD(P)-dependent oxidoreductase [Tateyamaria omphalii]GGX37864.1 SDR family oxidoreductase [Tateyamaria omphalii]